jgi:hypothetical protein
MSAGAALDTDRRLKVIDSGVVPGVVPRSAQNVCAGVALRYCAGLTETSVASIGQVPGSALRRVVDWLHVRFCSPTLNLADAWLRGGVLAAAGAWPWRYGSRPGGQPDPADRPSPGTSHAPARGFPG